MARLLVLLSALCLVSAAVDPGDLERYLSFELGWDRDLAHSTAEKEAPIMTTSRVSVDDLRPLYHTLFFSLNFDGSYVQANLIPLALQHVDPDGLEAMYQELYSPDGVDLDSDQARTKSIELVRNFTGPGQAKAIYKKLFFSSLSTSDRQKYAVLFAATGCDADALCSDQFCSNFDVDKAGKDCVNSFLGGLPRRIDTASYGYTCPYTDEYGFICPYDAKDFQDYYGSSWLARWLAAPQEKRVTSEGKEYTASQFQQHVGGDWQSEFGGAQISTQMRIDTDGKTYSMKQIATYYPDWQERWSQAPMAPCAQCRSEGDFLV